MAAADEQQPTTHRVRARPGRSSLLYRVLLCTALAFLTVASIPLAVDTGVEMSQGEGCRRPPYADVATAETLDVKWFPPAVLCRYRGYFPGFSDEWQPRWRLYLPLPMALAVLTIRTVRRDEHRRASEVAA